MATAIKFITLVERRRWLPQRPDKLLGLFVSSFASMQENWLASGGIVMIPLFGFFIVAIALILERIIFWVRVIRRQERLVKDVLALYHHAPQSAFSKLEQNADLPIARIFLAALELDHPNPEEFRLALESSAQAEIPLLKRFNTVFETIISISPLLGLLGTVLGLIRSFASLRIGDVGGSNSMGVSAGISEALISTASGLAVAITTLLFANTFRGLYLRQIALIQEYGGQLELLYRRR
jgi:biopolymer transport protein ExbB